MKQRFTLLCTLLLLVTLTIPAFAGRVLAEIEYFYSDDGTLIGKAFNGNRVNFEYDLRGQLLAVKDAQGKDLERYTYDPAGNRLSKTINGVTTTYTYDKANQLVTSTVNGVTTHYKYDAAGRMVQAGDKKYIYNGNNKVVAIWQNGDIIAKFEYNIDGQISKAIYGDKVEEFMWDGLALIWRSGVTYINEPYVTGGNPVMAGDDVLFNDMLGNTLAVNGNPVEMTSFGETTDKNAFFTGKPMIVELGYSFLFRDYNPNQGKWTTTDPLGYPDGWNNLAYVNNGVTTAIDWLGLTDWIRDANEPYVVGRLGFKYAWGIVDFEPGGWFLAPLEDWSPNVHRFGLIHDAWVDSLTAKNYPDWIVNIPTMPTAYTFALTLNFYDTGELAIGYTIDTGVAIHNYCLLPAYQWTDAHVITPVEYGIIAGANWTVDTANDITNLFNLMISNSRVLFNEAYNHVFTEGILE